MKYYFIGIKGAGMSTLANMIYDLGNQVVGYDDCDEYKFTMEGLEKRGITIHGKNNLPELDRDTIVVYTAAINETHPEVARVIRSGLKVIPYHTLIGELTREYESICVCGTHGKTTTSNLISKMLTRSIGCNYFVGDGSGYASKNNDILVIESCEYNKHFLSYYPNTVVLTNIELDHTETYPTLYEMIGAYQEFIDKATGKIIACGDDENVKKLSIIDRLFYGFNEDNDVVIKNKKVDAEGTHFDIFYKNKLFDSYTVNAFGNHLVLDMAGTISVGILYDINKDIIKETLINYEPAKRRFNETKLNDYIIVDDYAHHPTEIKVTYDSAHQKYPDKNVIAVFLPNTYSRTEALFDDFVKALKVYNKAYIMDIKCDREKQEDYPNISSDKLIEKIPGSEKISLDTVNKLDDHKNSVFCFMSCANISPLIDKFKENKQ